MTPMILATVATLALTCLPLVARADQEDDAVTCSSSACKVGNITDNVKVEIESRKDFAKLRIEFRPKTTNAQLASIAKLPWVTEVDVTSCSQLGNLAPLGKLKRLRVLRRCTCRSSRACRSWRRPSRSSSWG